MPVSTDGKFGNLTVSNRSEANLRGQRRKNLRADFPDAGRADSKIPSR
jgi:hypothetical protein